MRHEQQVLDEALILPALYAERDEARKWLDEVGAELVSTNGSYSAFRIPAPVK